MPEADKVCKRIVFAGRVQGVGFRYQTQALAGTAPVCGFVRNLSDGSVELVVEGKENDVERFRLAVCQRLARYIEEQTISEQTVQDFLDFRIRH